MREFERSWSEENLQRLQAKEKIEELEKRVAELTTTVATMTTTAEQQGAQSSWGCRGGRWRCCRSCIQIPG